MSKQLYSVKVTVTVAVTVLTASEDKLIVTAIIAN